LQRRSTLLEKSGQKIHEGLKQSFCPVITKINLKQERDNILDVERYLPAHLPKRNKYHLHEVADLKITNRKISISQLI